MYTENSIIITRVVNGWLLCLPENQQTDRQHELLEKQFKMGIDALKEINKSMNKDPLLESLQDGDEEIPITSPQKKNEGIPCEKNLFIFETFDELLSFLSNRVTYS